MMQDTSFSFEARRFFLEFNEPFSIAHGSRLGTDIVLLKISSDGFTGWGEASLPPYLPETQDSVLGFVNGFLGSVLSLNTDYKLIHEALMNYAPGNFAAKACVDIALCNWFAMRSGVPVWKWLGLTDQPIPFCTYTIGMASPDIIAGKVHKADDFQVLKVKLGGGSDREIIEAVRNATDKPVCVDVNQGWRDKEEVLRMIEWLAERQVLFVEQPLPKGRIDDIAWIRERSPLPVYADESAQVPEDIDAIGHAFDGVNVKLMKCGGITQGLKMINKARQKGLKVLIGSMSETSCGIMAAAQLSSLADYVDLDGPLLTKNNPFERPQYEKGRLLLS